jgi:hypothetical protein
MHEFVLSPPAFGFIVATRAALGVGIGLLLAEKLAQRRRRTIGLTLLTVGAATTIPAALTLIRGKRRAAAISDPETRSHDRLE